MSLAVILTFAIVAALEVAIPLALGYLLVRKFSLSWRIFLYGALFFILSQVIHIPLLVILQPPYIAWVKTVFPDTALSLAALALFLGLFAGLVEEGIRYLAFARFFPRKKIPPDREHGLLFGAGWGGLECIFVAFLVIQAMINYVLLTSGMLDALGINATLSDPAQQAALAALAGITPADILPGLLERMMTLVVQLAFTFLVLYSVVKARPAFLLAAIGWHALVDFMAVYLAGMYGIWPAEAMVSASAAVGLGIIWWAWKVLGPPDIPASTP